MNSDSVLEKLNSAVVQHQLTSRASEALSKLATDGHGISIQGAAGIIASLLNGTQVEAHEVMNELLAKNLLVVNEKNRYFVAYERLGINEVEQNTLIKLDEGYLAFGQPHSDMAMATLEAFFRDNDDTIYLGLGITSHDVFHCLEERAESGRMTILFFPHKSQVPSIRHRHYDDILAAWKVFLTNGRPSLRRYTRLMLASSPFTDLYTSALSAKLARFTVHTADAQSTRKGTLFQIEKGNSLYLMIASRFESLHAGSRPLFTIWPVEWLLYYLKRLLFPAFLAGTAICLSLAGTPLLGLGSSLALGLLRTIISDRLGMKQWSKPALFKK